MQKFYPFQTSSKEFCSVIFVLSIPNEYTADIHMQITVLSEFYMAVTPARTNLFILCDEKTEQIFRTVIGKTLYEKLTVSGSHEPAGSFINHYIIIL